MSKKRGPFGSPIPPEAPPSNIPPNWRHLATAPQHLGPPGPQLGPARPPALGAPLEQVHLSHQLRVQQGADALPAVRRGTTRRQQVWGARATELPAVQKTSGGCHRSCKGQEASPSPRTPAPCSSRRTDCRGGEVSGSDVRLFFFFFCLLGGGNPS